MSTAYNAVTVTSAATLIVPVISGRRGFAIVNNGSQTVYVGPDTSITISNAIPILTTGNMTDSGDGEVFKGAIYGIVASGSADVRWWHWTP